MGGCLSCPEGKPQPNSALGFRFKVFADYEAYIKCQGQVDQLFMVRLLLSGKAGGNWGECAPVEPFLRTPQCVGALGQGEAGWAASAAPHRGDLNQPASALQGCKPGRSWVSN